MADYDEGCDQIYISGLPRDVTEEQLAQHFGQIGTLLRWSSAARGPASLMMMLPL